ncbi:MAG: PD40 domain-containing protein [Flammeovirgaceae bacterium]|nr:MAG: PD40 domain-containing protein [Flammeovirgaceae bacterium]
MFIAFGIYAQAKVRKLPMTINHPSINVSAPFISADGSTLIYMSDYAEGNQLTIFYTQRQGGDWKEPVAMPRHINNPLNYKRGYALSADGKTIYITSIKSGGVGGYDIWQGNLKANSWGELENMFLPVNTKSHEGCPSLTPDGNTIYFMRCEKMDANKAENCKLFFSKKGAGGRWAEPVELPAHINTGNSQTPRIMADAETLIFSSDKLSPTKGGMDLFVTKLKDGNWSAPVPLDFVNTEKDDQFVSVASNGRYLLRDSPGKSKSELVEYLFPDELRPRGVMKLEGTVTEISGTMVPAYVSVTDIKTNNRFYSGRPDAKDGSYFVYLKEGSVYELSIDPESGNYTYFSKRFDLTNNPNLNVQRISTALKPLAVGDELELDALGFKPNSSQLNDADSELRRLSRLLKGNPQFSYELQVLLLGYQEDSVQSNADLTELALDSVIIQLNDIDSLGQLYQRDSVVVQRTWHNNRTNKQAEEVMKQLAALGVDTSALRYFTNARPEAIIENRKTQVRLVVKPKRP